MSNSFLSSVPMTIMERALYASSVRQNVISNNIANVNTPGFKKSEVSFEEQLQKALNGNVLPMTLTNDHHIATVKDSTDLSPNIHTVNNTTLRIDGNNVDIDEEMACLAKNNIYYQAVAQQMSKYLSNIKSAINEGRK